MAASRAPLRAIWSLCSALFALGSTEAASAPIVSGPFEIVVVPTKIGAGGFPNTTSNPFRRTTISMFRVTYRGKPVEVVDGNQKIVAFSAARILASAAQPTLLVALSGVYLVYEAQNQMKVDIVAPASTSDPAQWQWLDIDNGQPGPETPLALADATGDPLIERGGRLLLVNNRRVVDIGTMRQYPVALNASEAVNAMGGYNSSNDGAHALSPGRTTYVTVGSRYANDVFDYALVMAEFMTGRVYGVPFDRNALHFESVADVTPMWISHYFEWSKEPNGAEQLKRKASAKPLPWQGRFARFSGAMVDYRLYPTQPAMHEALVRFLRAEYKAGDAASASDGPQTKTVTIDGSLFHVDYRRGDLTTTLYADSGRGEPPVKAYELIEKIGVRFNDALARGEHQDLFTAFPPGK